MITCDDQYQIQQAMNRFVQSPLTNQLISTSMQQHSVIKMYEIITQYIHKSVHQAVVFWMECEDQRTHKAMDYVGCICSLCFVYQIFVSKRILSHVFRIVYEIELGSVINSRMHLVMNWQFKGRTRIIKD
eukprot:33437_1